MADRRQITNVAQSEILSELWRKKKDNEEEEEEDEDEDDSDDDDVEECILKDVFQAYRKCFNVFF